MLPKKSIVHFIGVGGIGISALARYYLSQGWAVSGSDLVRSEITKELASEGVKIKIGHKKNNIPENASLVIYSQAVRPSNVELRAARKLEIHSLSYPEAVGDLTRKYKTVAIAGAHGKSTTTALVSLALIKAGINPTVIIGTKLKEFGGKNFHGGRGEWLVLEADEFGRAFLRYSPALALITNIDREHLDTYKSLAGVQKAFLQLINGVKSGGTLILNKDSRPLFCLKKQIARIARQKNLLIIWYSGHSALAQKIKKLLLLPGEHNLSNATGAFTTAKALKVPEKKILSAISRYRGSWRRFEYRGTCRLPLVACRIYDDYAHHPSEIKATLAGFREKYPHSPIICAYQPHQALRLKKLWQDFVNAFGGADALILIPMYQVAGRDSIDPRYTSKTLAAAIKKKYPRKPVYYLANPKNIRKELISSIKLPTKSELAASPVVVMMGAGNVADYTKYLLQK